MADPEKVLTVSSQEAKGRARDILVLAAASLVGYLDSPDVPAALDLAVELYRAAGKRVRTKDEQQAAPFVKLPAATAATNGGER
jgi:hypothetical protein